MQALKTFKRKFRNALDFVEVKRQGRRNGRDFMSLNYKVAKVLCLSVSLLQRKGIMPYIS